MQLHPHLIGGSVDRATTQPTQAAFLDACESLDTERVHILTSMTATRVFYLAAPSREITDGQVRTPLAAALPGHPNHKGAGCYVVYDGAGATLVIYRDEKTLRVLPGSVESIQESLNSEGLPVYVMDLDAVDPWRLETETGKAKRTGDKWGARLQVIASVWALVACAAAAGLFVVAGLRDTASELHANQTKALVRQLKLAQPYAADLAELQKVSAQAIKAEGWIETYKKEGAQATYVLRLPPWANRQTIEALGPAVRIEFDKEANNLWVAQGARLKRKEAKK